MAAVDDQPRSGVNRRDALRLLAATTTTVAAGSLIISQPAFADSGSESCRFAFTGSPSVSVRMISQTGNRADFLSITVAGVNGACPCANRTAAYQFAYVITIPNTGIGGTGWITSSAVSVTSPTVLWPNEGGSATIAIGVRVTCPSGTGKNAGTATRCRSVGQTFSIGRNQDKLFPALTMSGDSAPGGLPACDGAAGSPQLRSSASVDGGSIGIAAGAGIAPKIDPNATEEPSVDLGTPDVETTTTTTALDKPGNVPKSKPPESTTTTTPPASTTTSATATTTVPPSTTTTPPSTTVPPSTTLPPG